MPKQQWKEHFDLLQIFFITVVKMNNVDKKFYCNNNNIHKCHNSQNNNFYIAMNLTIFDSGCVCYILKFPKIEIGQHFIHLYFQ